MSRASRIAFTFRDKNSLDDYGIYIARWPVIPTPKRRVHYIDIPGRSSTIWYDEKTYEDYAIVVECLVSRKTLQMTRPQFMNHLNEIREWLYGTPEESGESTLVFSFEPLVTRSAQVVHSYDSTPISDLFATFSVVFTCRATEGAITVGGDE